MDGERVSWGPHSFGFLPGCVCRGLSSCISWLKEAALLQESCPTGFLAFWGLPTCPRTCTSPGLLPSPVWSPCCLLTFPVHPSENKPCLKLLQFSVLAFCLLIFFYFFLNCIFNWGIVASQHHVGFCLAST